MSGAQRYTPPTDRVQADEAIKRNRTSRLALMASILFSILALGVSLVSYLEQRSINADQKDINEEQRRVIEDARAEKRVEHAIRVSWWTRGYEFHIQNRSLVPIKSVMLRYGASFQDPDKEDEALVPIEEGPLFLIDGIAPCTMLTLNWEAISNYYLGRAERSESSVSGIRDVYWERIDFTDAHGRWAVASGGAPRSIDPLDLSGLDLEGYVSILQFQVSPNGDDWWTVEQPASDCGSG
jgi:hypothetical protein